MPSTTRAHASLLLAAGLVLVVATPLRATGLSPDVVVAIDRVFESWAGSTSPGAAVGVVKGEELVFARGYGAANLDHEAPLTPQSSFYLASVSKQFAAAQIALLALRGDLSLDDDVRRFVPELPDYGKPIRVRHLVHHSSGLRDYLTLMSIAGRPFHDRFGNDDALELIVRQRALDFAPGSRELYSNSNYVLLVLVAERASGRSSDQLGRELVFEPLGMDATHWGTDPERVLAGRVTSYSRSAEDEAWRRHLHNFTAHGDGNLWSSVEDLARWAANLESGRVGGRQFLDLIATRGRLDSGAGAGIESSYAFGLAHGEHRGLPTLGHGGAFLGFRTELLRFPEQHLTVIVLANRGDANPGRLAREVADLVLAADGVELGPEEPTAADSPIEISAALLESHVGYYHDPVLGRRLTLVLDDDRLRLAGLGPELELRARSDRSFVNRGRGVSVEIEPGEAGAPAPALVLVTRSEPVPARHLRLRAATLPESQLREYAGSFWSPELEVVRRLEVRDGRLMLAADGRSGAPPLPLEAFEGGLFLGPGFSLAFELAEGSPGAFRLNAGRANGLLFERRP